MRRDANGARKLVRFEKCLVLLLILREDPLAGIAVWNILLPAQIVHHVFALKAHLGLEGRGAVEDSSMDDLKGSISSSRLYSLCAVLTSELRLLVSVPTEPCRSMSRVDVPSRSASLRAIARPTAPAPMTYTFLATQLFRS